MVKSFEAVSAYIAVTCAWRSPYVTRRTIPASRPLVICELKAFINPGQVHYNSMECCGIVRNIFAHFSHRPSEVSRIHCPRKSFLYWSWPSIFDAGSSSKAIRGSARRIRVMPCYMYPGQSWASMHGNIALMQLALALAFRCTAWYEAWVRLICEEEEKQRYDSTQPSG